MISRLSVFAVPIVGAIWLWVHLGQPAALIGLGLLMIPMLLTWPLVLVGLLVVVPYSLSLCWPRRARAWYRSGAPRSKQRSGRIPRLVEYAVYRADRHRCIVPRCGERGENVDHRVPWSWGGLSALPNLFLLCRRHNLIKMTFWVDLRGVEHGRTSNRALAREIWAAERRARRSLWRWLRITWALA